LLELYKVLEVAGVILINSPVKDLSLFMFVFP
jgi:hypothetical protein